MLIKKILRSTISWMLVLVITIALLEIILRLFDQLPVHANPLSGFHSPDAQVGWIGSANYNGRFQGADFNVTVDMDSEGLRRMTHSPTKHGSERTRVAFLGDSFTWGWGVNNAEVFTDVLQQLTQDKIKIKNFGVNAFSTAQQLLMLQYRVLDFSPDTVIVMFVSNDPVENSDDKEGRRPWFELVDGELIPRNQPVARDSVSQTKLFMQKSVALSLLKNSYHQLLSGLGKEKTSRQLVENPSNSITPKQWELERALLEEMSQICVQAKPSCELKIVYTPARNDVINYPHSGRAESAINLEVISNELSLDYLDLTPGLYTEWQKHEQAGTKATPIYLPQDGHWAPAGHISAAELIMQQWFTKD